MQKFPHDYFDKSEKENRIEKVIFEKTPDSKIIRMTSVNSELINQQGTATDFEIGKLTTGKYKLELFNIEGKDTIKTEKIFEVFDKAKLSENQKPFLKVIPVKSEYNRTEKAKFYVYSAIPDAMVNVYVQNGDGKTQFEQLPIKNGILIYEVPLPKDISIENLNVQFQMIAFNDVQTVSQDVKISSDKKPLKIELVTFRDKLQPNSKEKWSVKISGSSTSLTDQITAEVLANMYDKSLDQFAVNTYSWQSLYSKPYWISQYGINENLDQKYYSKRLKYFDNFGVNRPDFDWFDGGITYQLRGRAAGLIITESAVPSANVKIRGMASMKAEAVTDSAQSKEIDQVVVVGYGKKSC